MRRLCGRLNSGTGRSRFTSDLSSPSTSVPWAISATLSRSDDAWLRSPCAARAALTRCHSTLKSATSVIEYIARSTSGRPRRYRSKARSTASSSRPIALSSGLGGGDESWVLNRRDRWGSGQLAAPRGAVVLEAAPGAQRARLGTEVLAVAGPLDGLPERTHLAAEATRRLVGGVGGDRDRLGQVEQLHLGGALPEQLLAQQRVEVHATEPSLLVLLRRGPARLVVGDHEAPVRIELEPVDDADQAQTLDLDLEPQLDADRVDGGGVLEDERVAHEALRLVEERLARFVVEAELGVLGELAEGVRRRGQARERGREGALGRRERVQLLEGGVDQAAPHRRRRGRLGQVVDGREAERERAVLERRHLRRGEP